MTAIPELPVYDFEKLSPGQLTKAHAIFDEFLTKPLRPINELHLDKVRCLLDEALMVEVLGLPKSLMAPEGPFDLFCRKLGAEPSITGGKKRQLAINAILPSFIHLEYKPTDSTSRIVFGSVARQGLLLAYRRAQR